ncbi:MAG: DUF1295 domain-containing protein [Aeromicrobium sp.]|uniref:DUF1295 domain-containing protein n=1 Tax=Aeromicrobium sp. TaxID=1871063 RepID=UPI003C4BF48D
MIDNDFGQALLALLVGLVVVVAFMAACLAWSVRKQQLTVVDTAWGLGFVLVALSSAVVSWAGDEGDSVLPWILLAMTAMWGIRLAIYLHLRNRGKDEDPRYAEMADADGRSFARVAIARVFVPQGIAMFLVSTPLMIGAQNARISTPLLVLGLLVWATGVFFEAVGDAQLSQFKKDPDNQGKIMDQGLWRYTRHPNYFGDACVWTGIWLVVAGSLPGLLTVLSPIAMTIFLTKVTGASLNEKGMKKTKPGYEDYVRRTSGFIPLPPRKG